MIRITFLEDFWSHRSNWFKSWFRKHSKKTRSKFLNMMNSSSLMEVVLASLKPSKSRCQKLSLYFGEKRKVFSSYFVCWKPIWFTLVSWRSVVSGYWWMMPRVIMSPPQPSLRPTQVLTCSSNNTEILLRDCISVNVLHMKDISVKILYIKERNLTMKIRGSKGQG